MAAMVFAMALDLGAPTETARSKAKEAYRQLVADDEAFLAQIDTWIAPSAEAAPEDEAAPKDEAAPENETPP
jgi:hypothetical protein